MQTTEGDDIVDEENSDVVLEFRENHSDKLKRKRCAMNSRRRNHV